MLFFHHNSEPIHFQFPTKNTYLGEIEDMHAAILDGKPNYLTLQETRNHIRTVLELYESAKKEKKFGWIKKYFVVIMKNFSHDSKE